MRVYEYVFLLIKMIFVTDSRINVR